MRLQNLGYAVTAHRAQGITTDTAHTVVTETTARENFYVAMTRGRNANHAYVAVDRPDDAHSQPHPGDNTDATARSVLYGVMQHVGAELSAHETITAEQERWGSIAQLAAEYETIAQAAQHDRWAGPFYKRVASHPNKLKTCSPQMHTVHYRQSCGERKRITTMWTGSCHASYKPAASKTSMTSPRYCMPDSPKPPPAQPGQDGRANSHA